MLRKAEMVVLIYPFMCNNIYFKGAHMDDQQLVYKYWNTFGHLDFEPGEILSKDDILGSEAFANEEVDRLLILLSMPSDSLESPATTAH